MSVTIGRVADIVHLHPAKAWMQPLHIQTFRRLAGAGKYLLRLPKMRTFDGQLRILDRLIMCAIELRDQLLATREPLSLADLSARLDVVQARLTAPMDGPCEMFAPGMPLTGDHVIAFVDTRTIKSVDPAA